MDRNWLHVGTQLFGHVSDTYWIHVGRISDTYQHRCNLLLLRIRWADEMLSLDAMEALGFAMETNLDGPWAPIIKEMEAKWSRDKAALVKFRKVDHSAKQDIFAIADGNVLKFDDQY
jgi:hypothetical protein